jgi:hypothetical protein
MVEFAAQFAVASHDKVRGLLALPKHIEPAGFPAVYAQSSVLHRMSIFGLTWGPRGSWIGERRGKGLDPIWHQEHRWYAYARALIPCVPQLSANRTSS